MGVVIEGKGEQKEAPKVVERWGEPDASRCVLATSIVDREFDPVSCLYVLCYIIYVLYCCTSVLTFDSVCVLFSPLFINVLCMQCVSVFSTCMIEGIG